MFYLKKLNVPQHLNVSILKWQKNKTTQDTLVHPSHATKMFLNV